MSVLLLRSALIDFGGAARFLRLEMPLSRKESNP
jgi:hypothetical protein